MISAFRWFHPELGELNYPLVNSRPTECFGDVNGYHWHCCDLSEHKRQRYFCKHRWSPSYYRIIQFRSYKLLRTRCVDEERVAEIADWRFWHPTPILPSAKQRLAEVCARATFSSSPSVIPKTFSQRMAG